MINPKKLFLMRMLWLVVMIFISQGCEQERRLWVKFDDVAHLTTDSPVIMRGLTVGEINSMRILDQKSVLVELSLNEDLLNEVGFRVALVQLEYLGGMAIELIPDSTLGHVSRLDTLDGVKLDRPMIGDYDSIANAFVRDSILRVRDVKK